MSELDSFTAEVSSTAESAPEPEQKAETSPEPEQTEPVESSEVEAKAETEEPEGSTAEPEPESDKKEAPATIPIAALLDEREKRQQRDQEVAQLKEQIAELSKQSQEPVPDVLEDQQGFVGHLKKEFQSDVLTMRTELSQDMMRMVHDDYDDMEKKFYEMAVETPELAQQLVNAKNPAKFAYDTAKKAEKLARLENVDDFEAKVRAEVEEKVRKELEEKYSEKLGDIANKAGDLSPSLTGERAAGGNKVPPIEIPDPLASTFNR